MSHANIPELIRQRLLSVPLIAQKLGQRIHYQHIPQGSEYPHLWFSRRGSTTERAMEAEAIRYERFVFEIHARTFEGELFDAIVEVLDFDGVVLPNCTIATSDLDEVDDDYLFEAGKGDTALAAIGFVLTLYVVN